MIKAIVLDVDGVLKGSKEGVNFPIPHADVITELQSINMRGIPIILCTGNYYRSILDVINLAQLHNPHISDRGALIINPLDGVILEKHVIEEGPLKNLLEKLLSFNVYVEVYSEHGYFVQKDQLSEFTNVRTAIIQQNPIIVDRLLEAIPMRDVIKVNGYANTPEEKEQIIAILKPLHNDLAAAWGGNPAIGTTQIVNITKAGISKVHAMNVILKSLNIKPEDTLGVGDSMSDWEFMHECGYAAAMGNASDELKEQIQTKRDEKYFIAPHVDDNGILEVFKHFTL